MYIKLENLYGIKGLNAWYRKQGDGCFDFVNAKDHASYLTEEECEQTMKHKEWYLKQYNAERMVVDWQDTLKDRVIEGLKYCTPDKGCHDCPYYDTDSCDSIYECEILKDAVKLLKGEIKQ